MSRRSVLVTVGASLVSAGAASAVTWYLTNKAFNELYEERLADEVRASIDFLREQDIDFNDVVIEGPDELEIIEEKPVSVQEAFARVEEAAQPDEPEIVLGPAATAAAAMAANQKTEYHKIMTKEDYTEPVEDEEAPYQDPDISVISKDIFMANGSGWPQTQMTFFAADGAVLDEEMEYVEEHEKLIGTAPYPFGFTSDDPKVVYIKNKRLEQEFELIKDEGQATDFLAHSLQTAWSSRHIE